MLDFFAVFLTTTSNDLIFDSLQGVSTLFVPTITRIFNGFTGVINPRRMLTSTREKRSLSLFFPRRVREVVLIGRAMVHRVALEVSSPHHL